MLVSLILYICGHENAYDVRRTADMLIGCQNQKSGLGEFNIETEVIVISADSAQHYESLFKDAEDVTGTKGSIKFIDLSFRNYQTVAQLKNAAFPHASGEYIVFVPPGEVWRDDTFSNLIHGIKGQNTELDTAFEKLIMSGDSNIKAFAFCRETLCKCGGFNGKLRCGEEFEAALRVLDCDKVCADECVQMHTPVSFVFDQGAAKPIYQEHYDAYAYIIGRYAARLRESSIFDAVLMRYVQEAQEFGVHEYFMGLLEKMISKQEAFYEIDDAIKPVLIYMGDPICFDVLISFALEFAGELQKHGIPAIIYDISKEGTTGLAKFVDRHFRAVVGFQTALFSVRMKNSDELVNNRIIGPKINFLYDHPLYLYYHFTLELDKYYVLTQDEDYAEYINMHYPLIKRSLHLPPAGIELHDGQRAEWKDKIYDIAFVASYHDYRERTLALEMQTDAQIKPLAKQLLEEMKANPNMTAEAALAAVLEKYGDEMYKGTDESGISSSEFGVLLNKCMDACRVVMFYYREKVMETLLDAGLTIHVFGESWQMCPLAARSNMIIYPDVSYIDGIRILSQSKIALNVMSWHKAGMTERIANTMLNGTVCLTDRTKYLEEHFEDGRDIVMFDLERLDELPVKVKELLSDDERMQNIAAAGYENASRNHRWRNRVEKFVDMLDNGVFEGKI